MFVHVQNKVDYIFCQVCRNTLLCSIPKDFIELSVVEVEGGGRERERGSKCNVKVYEVKA